MNKGEANERLNDAVKNGTEADVNYWRGYCDAVAMVENWLKTPLTWEEVQRMDERPVWVFNSGYCIINLFLKQLRSAYGKVFDLKDLCDNGMLYRCELVED